MTASDLITMLRSAGRRAIPSRVREALKSLLAGSTRSRFRVSFQPVDDWPDADRGSSWTTPSVTSRFRSDIESVLRDSARPLQDGTRWPPFVQAGMNALHTIKLPDAALLDFGCGSGIFSQALRTSPATAKWKYTGADVNAELLRILREVHPGIRFEHLREGDGIPFEDDEFDVVLASGVLQYVEDWEGTLSELGRVTGKYLLLSRLPVWEHQAPRVLMQHVKHHRGEERYPMHVFRRDSLEDLLTPGFSILLREAGTETYSVPRVGEPVVHQLYLLSKAGSRAHLGVDE